MPGSLRIYRAPAARAPNLPGMAADPTVPAPAPTASVDDYVQKVIKLIPSEMVGAYLVGATMAPTVVGEQWWAAVCLVAVIVLRVYLTRRGPDASTPGRNVQWDSVAVAAVSFVIWVHAMGDHLPGLGWVPAHVASQALILWSIFAPIIVKGDPVPPGGQA